MSQITEQRNPGICPVQWCDETELHSSPHRSPLMDRFAFDIESGRRSILQLWLQGESARVRGLVLVTGDRETGLPWQLAEDLAHSILNAVQEHRHAD